MRSSSLALCGRGLPPRGLANRGVSALRGEAAPVDRGEAKRAERCAPACGDEPGALRVLPANGGDGGAGGKARSGGTFFGTSNVLAAALDAMSAAESQEQTKNPIERTGLFLPVNTRLLTLGGFRILGTLNAER